MSHLTVTKDTQQLKGEPDGLGLLMGGQLLNTFEDVKEQPEEPGKASPPPIPKSREQV